VRLVFSAVPASVINVMSVIKAVCTCICKKCDLSSLLLVKLVFQYNSLYIGLVSFFHQSGTIPQFCGHLLVLSLIFYSAPVGVQRIVISPSVCRPTSVSLCVCMSVCDHISGTADRHVILCADPLWSWLSPPLALRYVIYFRFYG